MEIISYVKWTKPGEKETFIRLAKTSKNDEELQNNLMRELEIDKLTAMRVIAKFREKINLLRTTL